jgi:hypothetical protein
MTVTIDDFMKDFTPEERVRVATRTAELKDDEQKNAGTIFSLDNRNRRVVEAGELSDDEVATIAEAEVPAEYAHLDELSKDWRP